MTEIFPPPGYRPAPSAVAGIEVYAPAPPEAGGHQEVVDFTCPQCGAVTAYSVADGGLRCAHCGYYQPARLAAVGRAAAQFEFTVETMDRVARGWGQERRELHCEHCGATLSLPPDHLTATCPFCDSNRVIQREAPQDVLRPRFLIPFRIEVPACRRISLEWLGSSWMTPANLRQAAGVTDFSAIYLPFWTFDAQARADWRAEVGHTESESYYEDGEWKTRTKTVWKWEDGHVELPFDDWLTTGTTRVSARLLQKVQTCDLNGLVPYEPQYLAGFQAQAYDVSLEAAWEAARAGMRDETRRRCMGQASSGTIRNFSMNLDFSDESWRYVLLPFYVSAYAYAGRTYQVLINGQTGSISGQRPVDWGKVGLVIGLLLAPGVLLSLAGLLTAFLGIGIPIGIVGFVLLVIGLIISMILFFKAQGMDDV